MSVAVSAVSNTATASSLTSSTTSDISADAFLKLLAQELQNQDPLEPASSQEMLDQIAQLTSVSELTQLNKNFTDMANGEKATSMASLLGKTVQWLDSATQETKSGVVSQVKVGGSGWDVCIGNSEISVHDVISVQ